VLHVIAACGGNVVSIVHERNSASTDVNGCKLHVELETRNHEHIREIRESLTEAGFKIVD